MDWKIFGIRFTGLVLLALLAAPAYAVTINVLIYFNLISLEVAGESYGHILTTRAVYVWMGSVLLGLASLFVRDKWRLIFYFSPLYAPCAFALFFTLGQK